MIDKYSGIAPVRIEMVPFTKIANTPPVYCQRNEQIRTRKIKNLLNSPRYYAPMLEYAIFILPVTPWRSKEEEQLGDGNSRKHVYTLGDTRFEPPENVVAKYYEIPVFETEEKEREYIKGLYYSFDNAAAAESGNEKITGVFRDKGVTFADRGLATGRISKVLEFASVNHPHISNYKNCWETVPFWLDELQALDSLPIGSKIPGRRFDTTWRTGAIMLMKLHGTNNQRLMTGLTMLGEGSHGTSEDGFRCPLIWIREEWATKEGRYLGNRQTTYDAMSEQLDFFLYFMNKWMMGEKVKVFKKATGRKRTNVYETFWDYLTEEEDDDLLSFE